MRRAWIVALLFAFAACGSGSDDVAGPGQGGGNLPNGSMSARIDNSNWAANVGITASFSGTIFAIAGTDGALTTLGFAVAAASPGTYPISPGQPTNAILSQGSTAAIWVAGTTRGSGSVTITSISATGAAGTFTFSLVPDGNSGSAGNRSVTNGTFNVTY